MPYSPFEKICGLTPVLVGLLENKDEQIFTDTCWALSYVTDNGSEKIQAVLDAGAAVKLMHLLDSVANTILIPLLRTIGNIVTGTDLQAAAIMDCNALSRLNALLLQNKTREIVKEAAWTLANIVAATSDQLGQVLKSGNLTVVATILRYGDFESQKEAARTVTNFTKGATFEQTMV